jgi:hypothetical protein
MMQQIIALALIAFFIWRLSVQKKKQQINKNEFVFWLFFWLLAAIAVIFIRQIDSLVELLGFSGSGINFLLYLAVLLLFYFVFRMRLNLAKMDKNITEITKKIALDNASRNNNK